MKPFRAAGRVAAGYNHTDEACHSLPRASPLHLSLRTILMTTPCSRAHYRTCFQISRSKIIDQMLLHKKTDMNIFSGRKIASMSFNTFSFPTRQYRRLISGLKLQTFPSGLTLIRNMQRLVSVEIKALQSS